MKLLGFISDTYKVDCIKNMTRQKRGTFSIKFSITGLEQNMPQGNNWQDHLNDSEYKDKLIEMIKQYVLKFGSEFCQDLLLLLLLQQEKNILFCLHEIKLLRGSKVDSDVIIFCKDTDVLILMI